MKGGSQIRTIGFEEKNNSEEKNSQEGGFVEEIVDDGPRSKKQKKTQETAEENKKGTMQKTEGKTLRGSTGKGINLRGQPLGSKKFKETTISCLIGSGVTSAKKRSRNKGGVDSIEVPLTVESGIKRTRKARTDLNIRG
jgi:hypothetical protein